MHCANGGKLGREQAVRIRMELRLLRGCRESEGMGWATYRCWERAESGWNKAASGGSEGVHTKRSYESARADTSKLKGSLADSPSCKGCPCLEPQSRDAWGNSEVRACGIQEIKVMCFPAWALVTMSILCESNQSESYSSEPPNPSCRVDAEMVPERQQDRGAPLQANR
jgi:hypothetical protein